MSSLISLYSYTISESATVFNSHCFRIAVLTALTLHFHSDNWALFTASLYSLMHALFSATAAKISTRYDKVVLIRLWTFLSFIVVIFLGWGFFSSIAWLMIIALLFFALFRTLLVPMELLYPPEILPDEKLQFANSLINGTGFVLIMCATLMGAFVTYTMTLQVIIVAIMLMLSIISVISMWFLQKQNTQKPGYAVGLNFLKHFWQAIAQSFHQDQRLFKNIILFSWIFTQSAVVTVLAITVNHSVWHSDEMTLGFSVLMSIAGVFFGTLISSFIPQSKLTNYLVTLVFLLNALSLFILGVILYSQSDMTAFHGLLALFHNARFDVSNALYFLMSFLFGLLSIPFVTSFNKNLEISHRINLAACNGSLNSLFVFAVLIIVNLVHVIGIPYWIILVIYGVISLFFIVVMAYWYVEKKSQLV